MQRSILEADQEEDNEESGDMNDDELNEIISRSDEEQRIFAEMDGTPFHLPTSYQIY